MCASTFCCGQSSEKPVLGATYEFLANIDFMTPLLARLGCVVEHAGTYFKRGKNSVSVEAKGGGGGHVLA